MNFFNQQPFRFVRRLTRNPTSGAWDPDPNFLMTQTLPPAAETVDVPNGPPGGDGKLVAPNPLGARITGISYAADGSIIDMFSSLLTLDFEVLTIVQQQNPVSNGGALYPDMDTRVVMAGNGATNFFPGYEVRLRVDLTQITPNGYRLFPWFLGAPTDDAAVQDVDVYLALT